jgi:putative aldouronate transport system substrate-binding protein
MKKFLIFVSCIVLISAVFTACKGSDKTQGSAVKLRMMVSVGSINENDITSFPVYEALEKAANVDLTIIQISAGEYADKQSVTLASGDIPDIILINTKENHIRFGDEGAFVNLLDYKDKLPNFFRYYDKYERNFKGLLSPSTGALYAFPQIYDFPYVGIGWMVRDDIITELGYDRNNIKTVDQFEELLYAMKRAYPDSKPYIGRWGMGWSIVGFLTDAGIGNGTGNGTGIYYDYNEKTYKYGPFTQELRRAVASYAKLAKDGIFEVDYNLSDAEWNERLTTGKAFVVWDYVDQNDTLNQVGKTEKINYDIRGMRGLSVDGRPAGKIEMWDVLDGTVWCISKGTKELDAALRLVDYIYSDDGITLTNWGIEGLTYETVNGEKRFTNYVQTIHNPNGLHPYAGGVLVGLNAYPRFAQVYTYEAFAGTQLDVSSDEAMRFTSEQGISISAKPVTNFTDAERELMANIMTPADTHANEQIALFISGDRPISQWDAFVRELKAFGVDDIVNLYNSKLK